MPRTAIIETATGAILVLDPPTNAEGAPLLPEGIDCRVVTLSDTQAAKLSQAGTYTVDQAGAVTVAPPPADPAATLKAQILTLAQSAVGVALSDLTQGQRSALVAALLFRAGGVTADMKVRPLAEWVR